MTCTSTALLTDKYELTMIEGAMKSGVANRDSVFEVFNRRLPRGRRYAVVAGIGRILEDLAKFTFGPEEIDYLRRENVVSEETLEWLANYSFSGDIWGYAEGECFFPQSPILTITGTFAECVVLETLFLSILNHDCAVAAAASRMTIAAHGRPCLEMGARRTHEEAAVAAARAAVVGGFSGTSVLEAGRLYGIPTIGTAAHSFTLVHDSEEDAFRAQIDSMGTDTTLLVDTYDVTNGVELAVKVAREAGGELGAVRLDSGDLVAQAFTVRKQLDDLGATTTKITVTSDLDEYAIGSLGAAPVDSYGVGTKLVTGSGFPTAELVYKLVSRKGDDGRYKEVAKKSSNKASYGGLKVAGRVLVDGVATEELVVSCETREQGEAYLKEKGARPLQIPLVLGGEVQPLPSLTEVAAHHVTSRAELPYAGWRLSEGEAAIPTTMVDIYDGDDA